MYKRISEYSMFKRAIKFINQIILLLVVATLAFTGCTKINNRIDTKLADQLQTVIDNQRKSLKIPGISAAMITSEGQKWLGVSGYSSNMDSVKSDMLFGLGSVTMTYTAALILQLAEEGALSVDDSIGYWFPDLGIIDVSITIRQLLYHTSGIYRYQQKPEYLNIIFTQPKKIWTSQDILKTFQGEPECQPDSCWGESAMDHILLGMVIEKITGSSITKQLQTKLFNPLKLENTFLYPHQKYPVEKMAHFWWDNYGSTELIDVFLEDTTDIPMASLFSSVWTAGAMHSTAEDLAIFVQKLFEGAVLKNKMLEDMVTPGPKMGQGEHYGYNVIIEQINGQTVYWHTGGIGYASIYYYLPDNGISIAVLSNLMVNIKPIAIALHEAYMKHQE